MVFKKNRHYCTPFPFPKFYKLYSGKTLTKTMTIVFDETIQYNLGSDQNDVNKLFGFSYGWHHKNSDRIGFRYVPELNNVELVLYSYNQGKRIPTKHIASVEINQPITIGLKITIFSTFRELTIVFNEFTEHRTIDFKPSWFGYTLGGYFGGNNTAPHKITIKQL